MNPITDLISDPTFSAKLAMALTHSLWQITLICVFAAFAGWVLRSSSASNRYTVLIVAQILVFACIPATYAVLHHSANIAQVSARDATLQVSPVSGPSDLSVQTRVSTLTPPYRQTGTELSGRSAYVATFYFVGVVLMLIRLLGGLYGGKRLVSTSRPISDVRVLRAIAHAVQAMKFAFTPAVAYCSSVVVPSVVGVLRPTLLLPFSVANELSPKQLEVLVMHELAHIRRHDHIINLIQRVVEAFHFYHPGVWYLSHRIRAERELCCDDLVIAAGGTAQRYAESLVRMAEISLANPLSTIGLVQLAATGKPSLLRHRVLRLLQNNDQPQLRLKRGGAILLSILAAMLFIAPVYIAAMMRPPMSSHDDVSEWMSDSLVPSPKSIARTPLSSFSSVGSLNDVVALLKSGSNPNIRQEDGSAPLHYAVSANRLDVAEALLDAGADINIQDKQGRTPLHMALRIGVTDSPVKNVFDENIVQFLLKRGANPDIPEQSGLTPLHGAILGRRGSVIEQLLKAGAHPNARDTLNRTALHMACITADLDSIGLLLDRGADPHATDSRGWSALDTLTVQSRGWSAALSERVRACAKRLLESGSKLDIVSAVVLGMEADVISELDSDTTIINIPPMKGYEGFQLLHWSAAVGDAKMCRILLDRGADADGRTTNGRTALHIAAGRIEAAPEAIRALLDNQANPNLMDRSGATPLSAAISQRNLQVVEMLISAGADVNLTGLSIPTLNLLTQVEARNQSSAGTMVARVLLDAKANTSAIDSYGQTALHTAVIGSCEQLIDLYLEFKADPNAKDRAGRTPLHLAVVAAKPSRTIVTKLLEAGANPLMTDAGGVRVIDAANASGNPEITAIVNRFASTGKSPSTRP